MSAGGAIAEFAPAKINLYLHVTGRRADGYHLLSSLVVFADVGDTISAAPARELSLGLDGPFAHGLGTGEDNLVLRAATKLAAATGVKAGARLTLTKRLPVSSGIGGGSADAAAAIRALAKLWNVDPGAEALARLGLEIGADVPVCLRGSPTLVSGMGEVLEPAPLLPLVWLALVNPGVAVPTKDVFAARAGGFTAADALTAAPKDTAEFARLLRERRNDLAAPACGIAPAIGEALDALAVQPNCLLARMSGSGATCFGIFASAAAAEAAARAIGNQKPGWWSVSAAVRR